MLENFNSFVVKIIEYCEHEVYEIMLAISLFFFALSTIECMQYSLHKKIERSNKAFLYISS